MLKLISVGLVAGLLFSSTFILNQLMNMQGGHWFWSASLRYVYMILFLIIYIIFFQHSSAVTMLL